MKYITILLSLLFLQFTFGQDEKLEPLEINLENYEYPFPVHFINLNIQGEKLKMAYMDVQSNKPNGKVVMLLHGKNFNAAYWEETAKELVKNGYRVILPDQIGFGKSSKPEHIQYSFHLLAQNTKDILDSLNIQKISVLGHSMGGMIATRFTLMFPEIVEKLILENPIGLEDWKVKVPYIDIDKNYQFELNQSYEKIKNYQLENYYDGKWKPEYEKWARLLAGWTLSDDYPKIAWNAALTSDMVFTQPVCYEFENIKVPTLLIIGQRDRTAIGKNLVPDSIKNTMGNYPLLGKLTAQKIKNSELVELENIGHLPHIEAFEKFINPLLNFLNEK